MPPKEQKSKEQKAKAAMHSSKGEYGASFSSSFLPQLFRGRKRRRMKEGLCFVTLAPGLALPPVSHGAARTARPCKGVRGRAEEKGPRIVRGGRSEAIPFFPSVSSHTPRASSPFFSSSPTTTMALNAKPDPLFLFLLRCFAFGACVFG